MKKRTICLLLAMIMVLSIVLAGCSKTAETPTADEPPATTEPAETTDNTETPEAPEETAEPALEQKTIQLMITGAGKQANSDKVWAAFNEQLQQYVPNTTVEFIDVPFEEYSEKFSQVLASGEGVDLAWTGWLINKPQNIADGNLMPLDDLLAEYGQGIVDILGENVVEIHRNAADGKLYYLPSWQGLCGERRGWLVVTEIAELAGDTWIEDTEAALNKWRNNYSGIEDFQAVLDQATKYLAAAKEAGKLGAGINTGRAFGWSMYNGTRSNPGVGGSEIGIPFEDNTFTVIDGVASEHYKLYAKTMADWYKEGYIRSDIMSVDTRCAFNVYIAGNFAVGMTNDSGFGIAPSLRQVWNNELYTSRWPWMAALRDGETDVYIPNIFKNNVIIYTDAAPRGSETSAYPWVKTNDNQESKITGLDNNLVILKGTGDNRQLFVDYANGNYALIDSVLAQLPGFEQIDQSRIGLGSEPVNQKPTVSGVSISGTAAVGKTLNAVYTFSDADGDSEGATVANYYISESRDDLFYLNWKKVSDNMSSTEFTVTPICEGKWIRCKVTPVDSRGAQGEPVWSAPVQVAFNPNGVDKTEFRKLVDEAKAKVEAAQIGDEPGQWTQKEIDLITAAIADAEAVLAKDPISQYDFDLGVAAFQKAYTRFCNNQNAGTATDVIEIDALIEDTENWTPYSGNKEGKPTFVGGKLTLNATSAYQTSCYTGRTYTNKTFLFDYQQTLPEGNDSWGGFYFNMGDAADLPYSQKCILVVAKADQTELQIYDGANPLVMKVSKFAFESGKTYRVEFGLYDVNSTDVRAVLTVDGKEILSYEAENEYLHSAKGRFGVVAAPNGMDVTLGSVGTKLTIDSLIDDETNWKTITNTFAPKFIASKMLLNGKSYTGYAGEKFTNRVLHFKYQLTFSEDAAAAGEWGGLYFNAGGAEVYPWTGTGILACIKSDVIELQVYEDGTRTKFLTNTENLLDSSKTYRMTFGMYDVNSTDVRIVMTADDVTLFDETITSAKLHGLTGYFGASASDAGVRAELGSLGNKINVSTLVRSEDSWKTYTGNAPEFKDGSLSITSSEASYELAAFADEKFSGKVFNFKYKQVIPEGADTWGGFYFNKSDPVAMPWADKGVLVVIKPYQVELQRYGDEGGILKTVTGEIFRSDMIYDVSFGIVDVNSTDVRIFVTVDGKTLFDETITDATLRGAGGYFGAIACPGGVQVTLNDLSGNDKHYNNLTELPLDAMIADKANWTDFSWAHYTPKPEFGDGTVSIASTTETKWALAGYKKQKFRNTEFQFKYRQTAAENDSKTANYGVLSWSFDSSVTNLSWNKAGGVMVTFEPDKTVLYAKGDADNGAVPKSDLTLENGKTYDMTFSFCQISANQLRVVLKVDGKEWFNEVYTDAMLANSAGYFNFGTRDNTSATIEKTGKVVVPEPDPEPTYDVVDVTDMLADTANWTLGYDAPTFATGSITAKTADGFSIGGYNTPVELGTVYRFKYKNVRASGWYDGFYLGFKAANIYWLDGGVQVDFNDDSTAIHFYNGNEMVHQKAQSPSIESGKEYEIEFGLLKAGDDTVKVHLTINGTPYFADVEVKNSVFVSTPLYFGIFARGSEATISKPDAK